MGYYKHYGSDNHDESYGRYDHEDHDESHEYDDHDDDHDESHEHKHRNDHDESYERNDHDDDDDHDFYILRPFLCDDDDDDDDDDFADEDDDVAVPARLVHREVMALVAQNPQLNVRDCTTKCDALFSLVAGHDETLTDALCLKECQL